MPPVEGASTMSVGCRNARPVCVWASREGRIARDGYQPVVLEVVGHAHEELEVVEGVPVLLSHRSPQIAQPLNGRVVEGREHGHAGAEVVNFEQLLLMVTCCCCCCCCADISLRMIVVASENIPQRVLMVVLYFEHFNDLLDHGSVSIAGVALENPIGEPQA
jgi:hypothetical protein